MPSLGFPRRESSAQASSRGGSAALTKPAHKRINPRPQRMHSWFNLIPVAELQARRSQRVLFLDTFVTIEELRDGTESSYRVLFEGKQEMCVVEQIGILFVWYGDELQKPDRPFPRLYEQLYDSQYVSSSPTIFEDTHVMDFVENGSDNLHFRVVHLWEYSKIYNHEVTEDRITLKQDTKFHFGSCSSRWWVRMMSKLLPQLVLTQDYVYHGPGLAVVGAQGSGSPNMHALVSLTPEGENRTRVYVTMAIDPETFPSWAERSFARISPSRALCDLLASLMANYIKNEFDVDRMIWANRKVLRDPRLLPSEKHLRKVMLWGESFYPKDFQPPEPSSKSAEEKRWHDLDALDCIKPGKLHRYRLGDAELVARRDGSGALRVFDAFCPHQGAHLGYGGTLHDDCLRCPFHGFYFDPEGRCIGPNLENRNKFIKTLELSSIEHRVIDGRVQVLI